MWRDMQRAAVARAGELEAEHAREASERENARRAEVAAREKAQQDQDVRVARARALGRERRSEVRRGLEMAETDAELRAERLALGQAALADVVAALRRRDELRLELEAWDLAAEAVGKYAAIQGRR